MTNLQEAKLAREAEICYVTLALVTDYDCWHPDHDSVTVEMIVQTLMQERRNRAACHRRGHHEAAGGALVRVRLGAEVRADHPARGRCRRRSRETSRPSSESTSPSSKKPGDHVNPILAVGSVAFDSIKTPFGEANRVVGGAATYFAIAASFFTEVRIVAVVGDDFGANVEKVFGGRRIDLAGLEKVPGETFRWKGEYGFDLNSRETIYTHLNVFEQFTPKIPPAHMTSPFVFLGNIHPTLQTRRVESGADAEARRRRHDELLDRADTGRAEDRAEAGRCAARSTTRRRASWRGEANLVKAAREGPGDGSEDAGHQARRARRADDAIGRRVFRGASHAARGGVRSDRAPAIRLRAAFWAISRRAMPSTTRRSPAPSSTAARWRHLPSRTSASIACCA